MKRYRTKITIYLDAKDKTDAENFLDKIAEVVEVVGEDHNVHVPQYLDPKPTK